MAEGGPSPEQQKAAMTEQIKKSVVANFEKQLSGVPKEQIGAAAGQMLQNIPQIKAQISAQNNIPMEILNAAFAEFEAKLKNLANSRGEG